MASRDKKPAKPSSSRTGGIHTLSDFQHYSSDSDSNPDGHQEYYTGGEKSGMLVQDPQKFKDVDALFSHVRQLGAVEGPIDHPSSPRIFTGTGRSLSGNTVSPASQHPEAIIHTIIFWSNGFTVNDGPLRRLDAPENAAFLESIQKSECPKELEPADKRSSVSVHLIRKNQECPGPAKRQACFQGVGRTLAGSSSEGGSEPTAAASQPPPTDLAVDETKPKTSIQLRLADGTRVIARFNLRHTVGDIRGFIEAASRPGTTGNYQLQMVGFPPKLLGDPNQTIEEAGLANSVVIQKF